VITIDEKRCTNCGLCIPICVRRILQEGDSSIQIIDPAQCLYCGHCKAVCPTDAPQFSEGNEEFTAVPSQEEIPSAVSFLRFLRNRRSLRLYQDKSVEKEKLQMLVEAGRFAPTGSNRQACEYVVVSGRKKLDKVCKIAIGNLQAQGEGIRKVIDKLNREKKPLSEELVARQTLPPVWERIAKKWEEGVDQLLHHAPALIIVHMKKGLATTPEIDAAIASTQMVLLAETSGLGTFWRRPRAWGLAISVSLSGRSRTPRS